MAEHLLAPHPAIGERHIPHLNITVFQTEHLLRLHELGQIQQFTGVLHCKLHAFHGVDEGGGAHQRGHDSQGQHQTERHLGRVQDPRLIERDAAGSVPSRVVGRMDRHRFMEAQVQRNHPMVKSRKEVTAWANF